MNRKKSRETARLEHCQECGSTSMKNEVYFCKGERVKVYVECAECGSFVSRYTLSGYTSSETYQSLLQKLRFQRINSGKRTMKTVQSFGRDVQEEFELVRQLIKTDQDARKMEEIIEEDFHGELE